MAEAEAEAVEVALESTASKTLNESFFGSPMCCKFGEDQDAVSKKALFKKIHIHFLNGAMRFLNVHSLSDILYFKAYHSPSILSPFDSVGTN